MGLIIGAPNIIRRPDLPPIPQPIPFERVSIPTSDWTLYDLYDRVEMPIVPLVERMQANGMRIDPKHMMGLEEHYLAKMREHTEAAANLIGMNPDELNLASPDDMAIVLYGRMGLKPPGMTKTGKRGSTDDKALSTLKERHPRGTVPGEYLYHLEEYRMYDKLEDSYCKKAIKLRDEFDRIYTTIKQTRVVSGRLSSAEPFNLMAIPVQGDEARDFRCGFIPRDGYHWLRWDFSQIEMRVLAHASHDPTMSAMFVLGQDIHAETASLMFKIAIAAVDKDKHRYPAKRVGFGVLFGLTPQGLLPHLPPESRTIEYATYLINRWYEVYADVRALIDLVHAFGRRYGWIPDQFGRVRQMPEMASAIASIRAGGEREAFSHFIQGTAQGCIKLPMGWTLPLIEHYGLDCYPLIQVHDEIDVEIRSDQVQEAAEIFGHYYANAVKLDVPVVVELEAGESWGNLGKILTVTSQG